MRAKIDVRVLTDFEVATFDLVTVLSYESTDCCLKCKPSKLYSSLILAFCFHLANIIFLVFFMGILH